jgi:hypothetical protein
MVCPGLGLNVPMGGEPQDQGIGDDILLLAWLHAADEPVGNRVPQAVGYVRWQANRDRDRLHAGIALPVVVLAFAPLGSAQRPGLTGRAFRFTVHRQTSGTRLAWRQAAEPPRRRLIAATEHSTLSASLQAYNLSSSQAGPLPPGRAAGLRRPATSENKNQKTR